MKRPHNASGMSYARRRPRVNNAQSLTNGDETILSLRAGNSTKTSDTQSLTPSVGIDKDAENGMPGPNDKADSVSASTSGKPISTRHAKSKTLGPFVATRPGTNAWGPSSTKRESERIGLSTCQLQHQQRSLADRSLDTARERLRRKVEQKKTAEEKLQAERRRAENLGKAARESSVENSGPKMLLAREMEAKRRREERAAAAKRDEAEELRLSSLFRATEV